MSHIATVSCKVSDLEAFGEACDALGGELRVGQKTFKSYAGGHCEHAVRLRNNHSAYEIGLTPRVDGEAGWNLAYDNWGPGQQLEQAFGKGLVDLQNNYLAVVAEKKLRESRWRVEREDVQGRIVLHAYA